MQSGQNSPLPAGRLFEMPDADRASREALRSAVRCLRRAVSPAERQAWSQAASRRVMELASVRCALAVAAYRSRPEEVDIDGLIASILGRGASVYLPRVRGDGELDLVPVLSLNEGFVTGAYGILEPQGPPVEDLSPIQSIIVPGIAFDSAGVRLGSGRGYYDRLLARFPPSATRVGVAFEKQVVEEIRSAPWDQPMDLVVTERRVLRCPRRTNCL